MSQFPIVSEAGLYEAVNYLASGPAGLGQNFSGFSAYQPAYLTGTFRAPFTVATTSTTNPPQWYVSPVSVSAVNPLNLVGGKTANFEYVFSSAQPNPPFSVGQQIKGRSFSPSFYNGNDGFVVSCSTTSVITQLNNTYVPPALVTAGTVRFDNRDVITSTDANARVTVTGPTEQVFISSQCQWNSQVSYSTSSQFDLVVQINRYRGSIDTAGQGAVDYLFDLESTVSEVIHRYDVSTTTNTTQIFDTGQNVFTTVIDQPSFGYFWYIFETEVVTAPTYRYDSQGNLVTGSNYDGTASGTGVSLGSTSTFAGVSLVNVSSSGTGGTADVEIQPNQTNYSQSATATLNGDGTGYSVGDTVKILGTDLGGATPANDMNVTIIQVGYPGDATPYTQTVGLRSLTAQVIKQ